MKTKTLLMSVAAAALLLSAQNAGASSYNNEGYICWDKSFCVSDNTSGAKTYLLTDSAGDSVEVTRERLVSLYDVMQRSPHTLRGQEAIDLIVHNELLNRLNGDETVDGSISQKVNEAINNTTTGFTADLNNLKKSDAAQNQNIDNLQKNVNQNTADIATNAEGIKANAADIATLNGSKNVEGSVANQIDSYNNDLIRGLYSSEGNVNVMDFASGTYAPNITTNAEGIKANAADIADLQTTSTSQGAAIQANTTDIATLQRTTDGMSTAIWENHYDILTLDAEIGNQANLTGANLTAGAAVATNLQSLNNGIEANTADIADLQTTSTSQGAAIQANAADIASLTTDVGKNTADIATLQRTTDGMSTAIWENHYDILTLDAEIGNQANLTGANLTAGAAVATNLQSLNNGIEANTATLASHQDWLEDLDSSFDARAAVAAGNITAAQYSGSNLESLVAGTVGTMTNLGPMDQIGSSDGDHRTGYNLALRGSTVANHLYSIDQSIGDRNAISGRYLTTGGSVASNLQSLNDGIEGVQRDVDELNDEVKGGFASVAALTALVPNARASGNTQIAVGSGAYRGQVGLAVGAFHYINDNVLLNAGASYGGEKSTIVKGGVTLGW